MSCEGPRTAKHQRSCWPGRINSLGQSTTCGCGLGQVAYRGNPSGSHARSRLSDSVRSCCAAYRFDRAQGYWAGLGWSARGPIKTESLRATDTTGAVQTQEAASPHPTAVPTRWRYHFVALLVP